MANQLRLLHPASQQARRQTELGMFLNSFRSTAVDRAAHSLRP